MPKDFASVVTALSRLPRVSTGRMFGSAGLKVGSKVFAMEVHGRLVVKLAPARAAQLRDGGVAKAFDPGHGRPMKQWVSIPPSADVDWIELAREAMTYVGG